MYTKLFRELSKDDALIAGGKGASLGEMTQAGIPVPPGFVVLADTFDSFLAETDLTQEIAAILETVEHDAMHTIEVASEKIQSLILSRTMPEDIRVEIEQQFQVLGAQYVAVRSSATAEDGADHAWAGQLESYLNTTHETLLAHVQKCWASLFTPRAIFYRFEKGLHSHHISVAVVVQKMVNSEKSGIAFSVHPVTEDRNQLIIEAGLGLGEAIVSGAVTPDSYVVSKVPRQIIDVNVNHQNRALYRDDAGGNVWHDLSPDHAAAQVLSTDEIQALSDIIVRIENHYGFPCDIEWAQESGNFYIVQSRPITTLGASSIDLPGNALEYEKHQRDYSVLGTSVVFNAYQSPQTESFFDISTNPYYILVENSVLYHFTPISESTLRAVHYLRNNNVNDIRQHKKHHDDVLGEYHSFLAQTTDNSRDAFEKLFSYFSRLLPMILVAIEVPEHTKDSAIVDVCLQIRRENEDVYKVGFDYLDAMLAVREKQDKLEPGTLSYLTQSEFYRYFATKELPADVLRRKEFILIEQHHESERISYQRSDLVTCGLLSTEKSIDTNEIYGTVAYRGNVSGAVRIIRKVGDIDSVREGDILVASMTDPRYVLAMQKVSAIVTDEGGITCHAAIVARELKKPCVIGTKIATQVLGDGDLVEVDAEKGVVRILEKSKQNSITVSRIYSREKALFYFSMWNDSDRRGWKKFINHEVSNNLFIIPTPGKKGSVWYSQTELDTIDQLLKEKLRSDPTLIQKIRETLDSNWDYLLRYLTGQKSVESVAEFDFYYEHLVDWWSAMNIAFTIPDMKDIVSEADREVILQYRVESEKYTEQMNKVMITFWKKTFPDLVEYTFFVLPSEINHVVNVDNKEATLEKIRARKDGCFMLNEKIYPLTELDTILNTHNIRCEQADVAGTSELKGSIAFKGKVRGTVRKILSFADMKSFVQGEVLVTEMTNPDYVPIMKMSAAVVTDEGGMTCHAAIASRELKIPCIVGTRVATQLLKDGDVVEVDAEKGIVKIITHT